MPKLSENIIDQVRDALRHGTWYFSEGGHHEYQPSNILPSEVSVQEEDQARVILEFMNLTTDEPFYYELVARPIKNPGK